MPRRWSQREREILLEGMEDGESLKQIAEKLPDRTEQACRMMHLKLSTMDLKNGRKRARSPYNLRSKSRSRNNSNNEDGDYQQKASKKRKLNGRKRKRKSRRDDTSSDDEQQSDDLKEEDLEKPTSEQKLRRNDGSPLKKRKIEDESEWINNYKPNGLSDILTWLWLKGFGKYVDILRPKFQERRVFNIRDLKVLEDDDLYKWGVVSIYDSKQILNAIKKL